MGQPNMRESVSGEDLDSFACVAALVSPRLPCCRAKTDVSPTTIQCTQTDKLCGFGVIQVGDVAAESPDFACSTHCSSKPCCVMSLAYWVDVALSQPPPPGSRRCSQKTVGGFRQMLRQVLGGRLSLCCLITVRGREVWASMDGAQPSALPMAVKGRDGSLESCGSPASGGPAEVEINSMGVAIPVEVRRN
jgi:hypothetical protein